MTKAQIIHNYMSSLGKKGGAACTGEPKRLAQIKSREVIRAKKAARLAVNIYRGYRIEPSGANYYVVDSKGSRAWTEVAASIETAQKWIDRELARGKGQI